jgi:hypothetical protein
VTITGAVVVTITFSKEISQFVAICRFSAGGIPEWVLFHEIVASNVPLMRIITKVNPLWILREGQHYYAKPDAKLMGPTNKAT